MQALVAWMSRELAGEPPAEPPPPTALELLESYICGDSSAAKSIDSVPPRSVLVDFTSTPDGCTVNANGVFNPVRVVGVKLRFLVVQLLPTDNCAEVEVTMRDLPVKMKSIVASDPPLSRHVSLDMGQGTPFAAAEPWLLPPYKVFDHLTARAPVEQAFRQPNKFSKEHYLFVPRVPPTAALLGDYARFHTHTAPVIRSVIKEHAGQWYRLPRELGLAIEEWSVKKHTPQKLQELDVRVFKIDGDGRSPDTFSGILQVDYF
jgi:hypothetical protein